MLHDNPRAPRFPLWVTALVTVAIGPTRAYPDDLSASEQAFARDVGVGFVISVSRHFMLAHQGVERSDAKRILAHMESTHDQVVRFAGRYQLALKTNADRLRAVCVVDPDRLRKLGVSMRPPWSGLYDPVTKRAYFDLSLRRTVADSGSARARAVADAERVTVRHESAHQLIDHHWPGLSKNMPDWLSEGLACAFEFEDGLQLFPTLNVYRARDLMHLADRRVDLTTVLGEREGRVALGDRYAVSWAIVYYLQRHRPADFQRLIHALNGRSAELSLPSEPERMVGSFDSATWTRVVDTVRRALLMQPDAPK